MASRMPRYSMVAAVAALVGAFVGGCAMLGGEDTGSGKGVATVPRKWDSVTMKNNDVLMGVLDFDALTLKTSYMPDLTLKKDDLDSVEFFGKGEAKVVTKHGDVLRGTVDKDTFRLNESKLPQAPSLKRDDIKIMHCR